MTTHAALLASLEPEARQIVQAIESTVAETQNHYGAYMNVLAQCPGKNAAHLFALAMLRVGANKQGIASALKALGYMQ